MTRRTVVALVLVAALPSLADSQPVSNQRPQTIAFPTFSVDQNWTRATRLILANGVGGFALAKSRGMSATAYGRASGDIFAPGWGPRDGGSAIGYARGIQNNLRAMVGTPVDVLSVNDTLITMRVVRSWQSYFGPTQSAYGVTLAEYDSVFAAFNDQVARYLGLRYAQRIDNDYVTITISGRGKNAVLDFPRGTYTLTLTAQDVPGHPEDVGAWEFTVAPNGRYTARKDGAPFVEGDYELAFDEVVLRNERDANGQPGCSGPGRFRWTVDPATGALGFGRLADDCDNRVLVLTRKPLTKR